MSIARRMSKVTYSAKRRIRNGPDRIKKSTGADVRCPACTVWFKSDVAYKEHYKEKHSKPSNARTRYSQLRIECQECFEEVGSYACIRPAHMKRANNDCLQL